MSFITNLFKKPKVDDIADIIQRLERLETNTNDAINQNANLNRRLVNNNADLDRRINVLINDVGKLMAKLQETKPQESTTAMTVTKSQEPTTAMTVTKPQEPTTAMTVTKSQEPTTAMTVTKPQEPTITVTKSQELTIPKPQEITTFKHDAEPYKRKARD